MDIDCDGGTIATGSWRPEECLQTWDYGTGELVHTFDWQLSTSNVDKEPCLVYATQISPDGSHIAAGGSGMNEVRVFNRRSGECVAKMDHLSGSVYSLDWAPTCDKVVAALADGSCQVLELGSIMSGSGITLDGGLGMGAE
jgi:WD40 repeat protein